MKDPTERILSCFEALNEIPRCSKHESRLAQWLIHWAQKRNHVYQNDAIGNLVIRIPARGNSDGPTVVLQGHMDMVCERTPESGHDFSKDPIRSIRREDWLTADGTTLGADNGIAIAIALVMAEDTALVHPPLELLFTVDEESGLSGAQKMDPGLISGKILINLDSEDEGCFTIGCSGGIDTQISTDFQPQALIPPYSLARLVVGGLRGGHSGVDINKHRGNANRILGRILAAIRKEATFRLVSFTGGSQHNAIPRDADTMIAYHPENSAIINEACNRAKQLIKQEVAAEEKNFNLTFTELVAQEQTALAAEDTDRMIWLILALPNGVARMSAEMKDTVETSSNLATVALHEGKLRILCSHRSAISSRLDEITATTHAVADLAGFQAENISSYPAWPPHDDSLILKRSLKVYHKLFAEKAKIQVMHAGLECAILGSLCSDMDMISLGPTIRYPHSPEERLYIPSLERVWRFLTALLEDLSASSISPK
jgi:dipeptidase D